MAFYYFQESYIWDGANRADKNRPVKKIKAKNEERARRQLPPAGLGRNWLAIPNPEDEKKTPCGRTDEGHGFHSYQLPSGMIKACDGRFYEDKK